VPLHLQQAYRNAGKQNGSFPQTERAAAEVISLPMHTELTEEQQRFIAHSVVEALEG
jgi:dTDP-4-amino-4,6-dideoxygalactose transaminase